MPAQAATATNGRQEAARLYQELEDRMLARDQEGGSRIYYELLRRGRPLPEIMAEAPDEAAERVDAAIESINLAIREIRNFIYGLRPEALDGTQVVAGLAALSEEVRHGGLVDVVAQLDPAADPGLDAGAGADLLNLVREALSNAVRHGQAGLISIDLVASETGSRLVIADDGVGFDPTAPIGAAHHGLANMSARAAAVGGRLEIESAPGDGTKVVVDLPRGVADREVRVAER